MNGVTRSKRARGRGMLSSDRRESGEVSMRDKVNKREWCPNYTTGSTVQDRHFRNESQEWIERHGDNIALAGEEYDIVTYRPR